MSINFLEIKNDHTNTLTEIISPYMYQGFQSIYESALAYKKKNNIEIDEHRIFQDLLRNVVPNWNSVVLDREVARIKICSKKGDLLEKLVKSIIKATLHIHCMSNSLSESTYLKKEIYETVNFSDFIHKAYVDIARELYNNPFLFRTYEVSPVTIKANQRDTLVLIKDRIKSTLRNLIPLEILLQEFLEYDDIKISVKLLTEDKNNNQIVSNPKKLDLEKKSAEGGTSIPLLNTVGENVMDKVFSSFQIKETLPNLVDMNDVESVISNSMKLNSHHTLSNFLKEPPPNIHTETIKQSAIEDYDAVYNND